MPTIYCARHLLYAQAPALDGGALLEQEGRIVALGSLSEMKKSAPGARVVDFGEAVLLPAFINAHTHLELSHYPAWASVAGVSSAPTNFVDWILRLIKVKRSVNPEMMNGAIRDGLRLCLESGTAAIGDILSWFGGCATYAGTPLRGRIFLESLGQDLALTQKLYQKLDAVLQQQKIGNFELGVSPHSPYTIRPKYMSQLFERCRRDHLACSTHIAESTAEIDFLDAADGELIEKLYAAVNWHQYRPEARNLRPIEYLDERGGLFPDQLLVHGVQLDNYEISAIAAVGAQLVLCPRSNTHLQVGTAPVARLKQAGVGLALGTDGLASNQSLSLWDELAFAAGVYSDALSADELLALATSGGARALGLQGQLGELKPGMRCSFQVIRREGPLRTQTLVETLVNDGQGQKVETLVLDGLSVL